MRSLWLSRMRPAPQARVRIVCLPAAGAGAAAYLDWPGLLDPDVEVWCAQLPGRERRFGEPALSSADAVAGPLAEEISVLLPRPYGLFGHSMGGLLAFEVARRTAPAHLFVSAARAPHLGLPGAPHLATDAGMLAWARDLGGVPDELDRAMVELLIPTLRADLRLCADYLDGGVRRPVPVPITAFGGADDPLATPEALAEWAAVTTAGFERITLPGGHFYLETEAVAVTAAVRDRLRSTVDTVAAEGIR